MTDIEQNRALLGLTVQIVAAHVQNNTVAAQELPDLIQQVYAALSQAGGAEKIEVVEKPAPVVPARKSIFPDYIICLEDGRKLKTLKRHLRSTYNMTPEQYREKWNLAPDYPMVAPNYAEHRSALAKQLGLGRKPAEVQEAAEPELAEPEEPVRPAPPRGTLRDPEPRKADHSAQSVFANFRGQPEEAEEAPAPAAADLKKSRRKPFSKQLARPMRG
jgi:predicted transcriptional regulator